MHIIDLHCDTASLIYDEQASLLTNPYHVSIEKMQQAGYSAQWFAFFIHLNQLKGMTPMQKLEAMHAYFLEEVRKYPQAIEIVTDYKGYKQCQEAGKVAAFLSLEEGQVVSGSLSNIDRLVAMGIRLMTLTWNMPNDLGAPHHLTGGLTRFGEEVVAYLNETPILLDISHLSESALACIRELYHKPIIASHSNARGYYNHTRNVSEAAIRQIAESGGIIGTNFYSYFLGDTDTTTLEMLVDAIRYMYQVGGESVLALGTDFDGIDCKLEVCNCSELDKLIHSLGKSFPSSVVEKLCYKNAERVIKENL